MEEGIGQFMKRYLAILLVLFTVTACGTGGGVVGSYLDQERPQDGMTDFGGSMSPRSFLMRNLPGGDDGYSIGFRDGCSTTMSFGVGLLRTHPFKYDVTRGMKDVQYYAGFRAGTVYCTYYADVDPL